MRCPEFFHDDELTCHCGCGLMPPRRAIERLYAVRLLVHKPMPVSSAARCEAHNAASGGSVGSIHLPEDYRVGDSKNWGGGAFDIIANHRFQLEIYEAAKTAGFRGFGFASEFIHIDDAACPAIRVWRY